ncbi:MAG TPA: acyl-CoA dehydrogenase family protein [Terriglobia bacterium]|nr:acyl-CoA dehydrogenase family protein [Terriglobia bacterium]
MDFSWSEEQEALRRSITQFAQNELASDVVAEDQAQEFSWDGWRKCARFGIQGMPAPAEYGGGDADVLTMVGALESLGYGCRNAGLIFSLNAHLWGAVMPLALFGNGEQKQKYLPRLANGEWVGGQAGADLTIRAARQGDGWCLSGRTFVANAGMADLVVVYAAVETTEAGEDCSAAFLVEKGTPGLRAESSVERMGLRTSPAGDLVLDGCRIADSNCLGEIGGGQTILESVREWERICVPAPELGMMQHQVEVSARYAAERRQFGQPIGKFPAIAEKVANMDIRLETARLLLYKAAWLKNQGRSARRESAIAKTYVADAAIQTCRDALQIHGGYGYMTEYQIERDLRDAISAKIYSGAGEMEKRIIADCRLPIAGSR